MPFDFDTAVDVVEIDEGLKASNNFDFSTAEDIVVDKNYLTDYDRFVVSQWDTQIKEALSKPIDEREIVNIKAAEVETPNALWSGVIPYVKGAAGFFTRPFGIEPMAFVTEEKQAKAKEAHPFAYSIGEIIGGVAPFIVTAPLFPQTLLGTAATFGAVSGIREFGEQQIEDSLMTPIPQEISDIGKEALKGAAYAPIWHYANYLRFAGRPFASALVRAGVKGTGSATLSAVFGDDLENALKQGGLITALSLIFEAPALAKTALGRGILTKANAKATEYYTKLGYPETEIKLEKEIGGIDRWDEAITRTNTFKLVNALYKLMKYKIDRAETPDVKTQAVQRYLALPRPVEIVNPETKAIISVPIREEVMPEVPVLPLAIRLKSGEIITDPIAKLHSDIITNKGINPDDVQDVGITNKEGEYQVVKAPDEKGGAPLEELPEVPEEVLEKAKGIIKLKKLTKEEVFPDALSRLYISEQAYIQKAIVEGKSAKQIAKELDEDIEDTKEGIKFAVEHYREAEEEFRQEVEKAGGEQELAEKQAIINKVKDIAKEKDISQASVARLKRYFNIRELKNAGMPELKRLIDYLEGMKKGDAFLSEAQFAALYDIIKGIPDVAITPKRIIFEQLGEKEAPLAKGILGKVSLEMIPTVDIKEKNPLVKQIVEEGEILIDNVEEEVSRRDEQLDKMLIEAEKTRAEKLSIGEKLKRQIVPQNTEIFQALSGEPIELTKKETAVVAYLKNFFAKVKREFELEKYRKHYVTHLEQTLTEKILNEGLIQAVADIFNMREKETIPINILLELDNIIGSEKFFRFALQRKGGISPTANIRRIIHTYSQLYETKKALDAILPKGQALVKTLLQPQTAVWMKRYLQNLKGRGLDLNFRRGRMGWLANIADNIIDIGYLKLLGLNYWSALKNLTAGEANSFIYQDFQNFLKGKQRMISHPKKLFDMAKDNYILEGTYAEYTQRGIGQLKKLQNLLMIGQQVGEYEIRGSMFAGELTEGEWQKGEISPQRVQQIKDTIAITQGIFSKTQSPLWMQTWYGRMFMQMNRWRVTNAMLFRRIALDVANDIKKQGKPTKQHAERLAKMFIMYGAGMWLAYQAGKAGFRKLAKVAQSMAELVNNTIEIVTMKPIVDAITDNPTISVLKEIAFSIQELAVYIHIPGVEEPERVEFREGIEETFIAPVERTKELIETIEGE